MADARGRPSAAGRRRTDRGLRHPGRHAHPVAGAAPSGRRSALGRYPGRGPRWLLGPVAVLTDERTASSGEAVAVAFRGMPAARSYKAATHGFSTGNEVVRLPDGALLVITTCRFADRAGQLYGGPLIPDVPAVDTSRTTNRTGVPWVARATVRDRFARCRAGVRGRAAGAALVTAPTDGYRAGDHGLACLRCG